MAAILWHVCMDPNVKGMAHSATLVPMTPTFHRRRRIFSLVTHPKAFTHTYHHPAWEHRAILHNCRCLYIPRRKTNCDRHRFLGM